MHIDHIDKNKLNNNVSNLRYITQKENCKNHDRYRDDIKETDPVLRKRIFTNESAIKSGRNKNLRRKRGTGGVISRGDGKWRAVIKINNIKYDKTFYDKDEAENYLQNIKQVCGK